MQYSAAVRHVLQLQLTEAKNRRVPAPSPAHSLLQLLHSVCKLQASLPCERSCCTGWLNLLLKYMWPGFVSNIATNLTVNQLNNLFERLSRMLAAMPIFRVVFSQMLLRELSLGATPPRFANGTVRIPAAPKPALVL